MNVLPLKMNKKKVVMKKNLILSISLLYSICIFSEEQIQNQDEDFALLQEAIEIVASMSDNIANLVIQHKIEANSAELTKQECIALIQKMTSFVVIILKKQKLKKISKKIILYSSENIQEQIDHIAENIFYKIQIG